MEYKISFFDVCDYVANKIKPLTDERMTLMRRWKEKLDAYNNYYWDTKEGNLVFLKNIADFFPWLLEGKPLEMTDDWLDKIHGMLME